MRKKICLMLFLLSLSLFGNIDKKTYNFTVPDGLPSLSISFMMGDTEKIVGAGGAARVEHMIGDDLITYNIEKMPEALVAKLMKKEPDIAIVPANLAAQLYNKNLGYKIAGTVGWGSFYLVGRTKFESFDKLKGDGIKKIKIGLIGKGLTPDIVYRKILKENNIAIDKDIEVEYYANGNELMPLYLSKKLDVIVIAEPALGNILKKDKDTLISFNLNEEWKKIYNSQYGYPQSTLIVKESIYGNKELLSKVLELIQKSTKNLTIESAEKVEENIYRMYLKDRYSNNIKEFTGDASSYKNKLVMLYSDIGETLKRSNINFIEVEKTQNEYMNYFRVIEEMDKKMIGGKIPDEKIFIKE